MIMLLSGSSGLLFPRVDGEGSGDYPPPSEGDWIITTQTNVTDETIYMSANIFIKNGGTLHLENVNIIFNSTRNGEFRLDVENGGTLFMYNSTIDRGTDFSYGFRSMDGGKIRVENSEIRRCGYNKWHYYGLTIYSNDAVIRNNLFTQGYIGLYCYVASGLEASGNSFINNTYVALYLHTTNDFLASGNTMDHNDYGIYMHKSFDGVAMLNTVRNNSGLTVGQGIQTSRCDNITIRDNVVDETLEALYSHTSTNITFQDNLATNSTRGIRVHNSQHVTILRNRLYSNIHGMHIAVNGRDITIRENNASFNKDYNMYIYRIQDSIVQENDIKNATVHHGIAVRECRNIEVDDNTITGNIDRGLWLWDSDNITLDTNVISDSNLGYYVLLSEDNLFANGEISNNNYGIYFDRSVRNVIENSSSILNNDQDIHMRGASRELVLLNTVLDNKEFHDDESEFIERFYLNVEVQGRSGPVSGVDIEVTEMLNENVIYATPAFGGTDKLTDDSGQVRWITPLYSINNKEGTTLCQVRIRVNDHGVFEDERYGYVERQKTVTFTKSALTVDKAGNGDFLTIQEAIDDADDGDSILVASGIYEENIIIDKTIEIYGKGGQVTLDAMGGIGFLTQGVTTLANFTITNSSTDFDIQERTNIYNVTFSTVNFDASHILAVGFYLNIHTVDENLEPIPRTNVTIENVPFPQFFPQRYYESDPNGVAKDIPILDYADSSSNHWEINPYIINATKVFRSASTELTVHSNMDLYINLTRHGGFGTSLTTGDFNDDGYEDYAVGAPYDDEGGEDAGAVFIYFGPHDGAELLRPIDADLVLNGERLQSLYGFSLASGDINGDYLDDLIVSAPQYNATGINGLMGWYWNGEDFTDFEYTRVVPQIDFPWGNDEPGGLGQRFAVNWSGYLYVTIDDYYTFYFEHDDGVRFHIGDEVILEAWSYTGREASTDQPVHLTPGYYPIEIEFYDSGGEARCIWKWETSEMEKQVVPTEHLFYTLDMTPGNGAVYVYSGELFDRENIRTDDGIRQGGAFPMYGETLSIGDTNQDAMEDILVGFDGGTTILYGSNMLYHHNFLEEPMLSSEWDPVIEGRGGEMSLSGGTLTIDTESDAEAYAYSMSKESLDYGFGISSQVERGSGAMYLAAIDYKVTPEDVNNLSKQEDHTLFSIYANGQIKYWPSYGGNVRIESPDVGNVQRLYITVIVTDNFDHLYVYLNDELEVDSPLTGWSSVYLKIGDSTNFGLATINVIDMVPYLREKIILGWESAVMLNNTERNIAASVGGESYLFSTDMDDYSLNSSSERQHFVGIHNYTTFKNGITLSPFLPIPIMQNGDFNNGWDNWTQTDNIREKNNGEWDITTEERGDWHVYDGPTAGLGPDRDTVADGYNGRDCDGKLVSDPFLITADVKYVDFWHHAKWFSFEVVGDPYQENYDDMIVFRLVRESNGRTVREIIYQKPPTSGEEEGRLQFDVSEFEGEYLIFEMEMVNDYRQYDDGLVQIDNITGAKENEDLAGYFISSLAEFGTPFSAFIPLWQGDAHGGNLTIHYRTNESDQWILITDGLNIVGSKETMFQYRITLEGVKGNPYPILRSLDFTFINNTPVHLQSGRPVQIGEYIEANTLGVVDGNTLTLYSGETPMQNITGNGGILDVAAPGDIDINGNHDLMVSTDGNVYLILVDDHDDLNLQDADYHFTGEIGYGSFLQSNLVGSPLENDDDGRVHILPMYKENLAIIGLNLEDGVLIYPDTLRTLIPIVKNTGLVRLENVGLKLEITAPFYSHQETIQLSLDPGEEAEVPFVWNVPLDEQVEYFIRFTLDPDMHATDNLKELSVTTRHHGLSLATSKDYETVAVNGTASYHIVITNIGTLGEDNVSFDMDLPDGWDWWLSKGGINFTSILVTGSLSFDVHVETSSPLGIYAIDLIAISENGTTNAVLQLETHIVDRDIIPVQVRYFREDGKEGIPISGETTSVVLTLQNLGIETVSNFNVTLYLDDQPVDDLSLPGISSDSFENITFPVIFTEGSHDLLFVVDERDVIREYNENNNEFTSSIEVKPEISSIPFLFRVHVTDLDGRNFTDARIRISSGSNIIENITDDSGNSLLTVDSYPEGDIFLVEAISGDLYASDSIAVYSEDQEAVIELVVGRYSFIFSSDARDKSILPGGNQSYILNITNTGDFADDYTITITGLPEDWAASISGDGYDSGNLSVSKDTTATLTFDLSAWQYAPAYQRYEIIITASSHISPYAVDDLLLRATVELVDNITMTTEDPDEYGLPKDPITHRIYIKNFGNAEREINLMIEGDVQHSTLNKNHLTLEPGKEQEILFIITIPNLRVGTILNHELYGIVSGVGSTSSLYFTTYINSTSGNYLDAEIIGNTLQVTHKGNKMDHLTVTMDTNLAIVTPIPSSFDLDMGETAVIDLDVEMIEMNIQAGAFISVFVSIYNGDRYFINSTRNLRVPPVYDIALEVENTTMKALPGSLAGLDILVKNTGNVDQIVFFTAINSGSEPIQVPSPLSLGRNKEEYVSTSLQIPEDAYGERTITFTATSNDVGVSLVLTLDLTVTRDISLQEISVRAFEGGTKYTINLLNQGDIDELLDIEATCGELDLTVAEVDAGDYTQFHLTVPEMTVCPGIITLKASSGTGEGIEESLELIPPPYVTIDVLSEVPATVLEPVILEASGAYRSYTWSVESRNLLGKRIYYNFSSSGTHQVQLTVIDTRDIISVFVIEIYVENQIPSIDIEPALFGNAGEFIEFDARKSFDPDGTIAEFRWIIEGVEFTGPHVHHIFDEGGTYNVTFIITDNEGATATTTVPVTVRSTTPPMPEEKEELDMTIVTVSLLLLVLLIGLFAFFILRMHTEENTLLSRLQEIESMGVKGGMADVTVVSIPGEVSSTCPKCGYQVPGNFKFCNKCGSTLESGRGMEHVPGKFIYCNDCGARVPDKFRFCNKCGSPIDHQEVS